MTDLELTTLPGPDRSVPQQLVDIAVLAIRRGAQRVSLHLEGLGADFPAPIGWLLRITRVDDPRLRSGRHRDYLHHQVGCDLGDLVTPAWLASADDAVVVEELVELFTSGIVNGWSVTYERDVFDHAVMRELAEEDGRALRFGMRHKLEADAANWSYSIDPHAPASVISTNVHLSIREGEPRDVVAFSDDGGTHRQVTETHIADLLRQTAPHHAPVAYWDTNLEKWVL